MTRRRTPIGPTIRRVFVEMADSAAYSKRQYKANPNARDADFDRHRWTILENAIETCLYVALHWTQEDARKYAGALVLTREEWQTREAPGS